MKIKRVVVAASLATALIVVVAWAWDRKFSGASLSSLAGPQNQSAVPNTITSKIFRDGEFKFSVKYPQEYQIQVKSLNGLPYDKGFLFSVSDSVPLRLRVINLDRYLPTTNAPTVAEYLKTFRSLDNFQQASIARKVAYEYLACGSAACTQEVVFIHGTTLYDFSIDQFQNMDPHSISFANSPLEIRAIVESLEFTA